MVNLSTEWSKKLFTINHYELQNGKCIVTQELSAYLKLARKYLIRKDTGPGIDIIRLMSQYVHAVKTDFRQFDRPLRGIGAIHFHYR